jgi:hypothetical protein
VNKIIDLTGKPMNGGATIRAPHAVSVPDLPGNPTDLDAVANGIEGMGVKTATEAFMVAVLRAHAKALRRIEALEAKKNG